MPPRLRFLENSLLVSKPGGRPPPSSSLKLTPRGMTMVASTCFLAGPGAGAVAGAEAGAEAGVPVFQFQFNLAEPQRLAGLQNAFGDLFAVDERAVRRIEVFDDDITAAQQHFAMMAGDGRLGDLKHVILDAANRGAIHVQLVRAAGQALSQNNKFGHGLTISRLWSRRVSSQTEIWENDFFNPAAQSARGIRRTTASNRAARATLRDDIARKKPAWSCGAGPRRFDRSN